METHDIELHPGDSYRLDLGGLGSAGYAWEREILGPAGIAELDLEAGAGPARPAPGGPPPDNFSTHSVAVIDALAPGEVTVTLSQRRPWEPDSTPLRQVTIRIRVTETGAG